MKSNYTTDTESNVAVSEYLPSKHVMRLLCCKNSASFYETVRKQGIPHVTINRRKIVFPAAALNAWLASRSSTGRAA
jgi:hypothetical protein